MTKEDLQQLSELIDKKLEPINKRLDNIEEQIAEIKEDTEETRGTVNEIGKWVELNATPSNPYPVDMKAI